MYNHNLWKITYLCIIYSISQYDTQWIAHAKQSEEMVLWAPLPFCFHLLKQPQIQERSTQEILSHKIRAWAQFSNGVSIYEILIIYTSP